MEGWESCDPRPRLSPSALQPPAQKSQQQQPLATLAQGHRDKVRGGGGDTARTRVKVRVCERADCPATQQAEENDNK